MVLYERLMPSDEYVSVSGEAGVLNEEVDLCKVGRDGNRKREREKEGGAVYLGEHRFESGGDESATD